MDAFLTKPVDPKTLFATIDRLVGGQPIAAVNSSRSAHELQSGGR